MSSHLSFQTSYFSKKIRKDTPTHSTTRRKCSDLLLPRSNWALNSEISSPAIMQKELLTSPRSAAIIRFNEDLHSKNTKNKLLKSLLLLKDAKELEELFDQKKTGTNKGDKLQKIEQIVAKLQQPQQRDFLSQIKQIKQLSYTQEEIVQEILNQNPQSKQIQQIYSLMMNKLSLEEEMLEDNLRNQQNNQNEENFEIYSNLNSNFSNVQRDPNISSNKPQLIQEESHFNGEFIENFDFKLNFSSPFIKKTRSFDKENCLKGLSIENNCWRNSQKTPGTSTPCTTPLLERKKLLSSTKIEDMTDFIPEKKDLLGDFNELLQEFNENENNQWKFEEIEEWENKDLKEEDFLA